MRILFFFARIVDIFTTDRSENIQPVAAMHGNTTMPRLERG